MSRFLSWFLFFCLLIVTTAYPVDHQKRDITPIPNFQVELDPVPQTLASVTQPWIEDTLSNVYTPPFFYFDDKNQIASEATRLTPEQTCVLKSLLIRFYNYDTTKAKSKSVQFFVWDDQNGLPGATLFMREYQLNLEAGIAPWYEVDVSQESLIFNDSFWIGHRELTTGPPSSIVDSIATPGANFYSYDGKTWKEDSYDYLQRAVVHYISGGRPEILIAPDTLYFQVGTEPVLSSSKITADQAKSRLDFSSMDMQIPALPNVSSALQELDTLTNVYQEPFVSFRDAYQTQYEATRLISVKPCTLKSILAGFRNRESFPLAKGVNFYAWSDLGGKPGSELISVETQVSLGPNLTVWISVEVSGYDLIFNGPFWVGHRENSAGSPTSLSDTMETPGANYYRTESTEWTEDMMDYLHMAAVEYGEDMDGDEDLSTMIVRNVGNAELLVQSLYADVSWITHIQPSMFVVLPGNSQAVTVTANADDLPVGSYDGILHVTSNDAETPDYEEPLLFAIRPGPIGEPDILVAPDTLWIEGYENEDDTTFLRVSNGGTGDLMLQNVFSQDPFVVNLSPLSLVLAPGESQNIQVIVSASDLTPGIYPGALSLLSNDPDKPVLSESLIYHVLQKNPEIAVVPDTLFFKADTGQTDTSFFIISNLDKGVLQVSDITSAEPWVSDVDPKNFQVVPGDHRNVMVVVIAANLHPGTHEGKLHLSSNDPDTPDYKITMIFDVLIKLPDIAITPDSLRFETEIGDSDTAVFSVINQGEGDLIVERIDPDVTWVNSVEPDSLILAMGEHRNVLVVANAAGLSAGRYSGMLHIHSNDPDTSEVLLPISLKVLQPVIRVPDIAVIPDTLLFNIIVVQNRGASIPNASLQEETAIMTVMNAGTADLQVSMIFADVPWVTQISQSGFIVTPGDSQNVEVTVNAEMLESGVYEGLLHLHSNDPDTPDYPQYLLLNFIKTGVRNDVTGQKPENYILHQNYPNPFNPLTMIRYQVPEPCHVTIEIYNSIGERVVVLVDSDCAAGIYSVSWDARNQSGSELTSGLYFYRMRTGSYSQMRKMVLLY